jgi:hypothetical protein
MEILMDRSPSSACKLSQPIVFAIDLSDPEALEPNAPERNRHYSMVVRIEPQDLLFLLSATEPEKASRTFAEALAKRTALSAIEKDFPTGVELSLTAKEIDRVPPEIANRLPDFYMNGNDAWLLGLEAATPALASSQAPPHR